MSEIERKAQHNRRVATLRGQILRMVYRCQREAEPTPNHVELQGALRRMMYRVSRNEVKDVLTDLRDRGYITFRIAEDEETGYELWGELLVTPKGRDVVNGDHSDSAVQM